MPKMKSAKSIQSVAQGKAARKKAKRQRVQGRGLVATAKVDLDGVAFESLTPEQKDQILKALAVRFGIIGGDS